MADLTQVDTTELRNRLEFVMNELDKILKEIGPKVKQVGHLREETSILVEELRKRGMPLDPAPGKDGS
jgi:hypothetical protein